MVIAVLATLLLSADAAPLPADNPAAESRLRRALYYFNQGDYAAIVAMMEPLLDPPRFADEDELVLARKMLGTVYFLLDAPDRARRQFKLLLVIRPDATLDPYSTAPPVLRFFADVKREIGEEAAEVQRAFAERKAHFEAPRTFEKTNLKRNELLCYFPFGVGQFYNGDTKLGALFLGLEAMFLAANVLGYVFHALLADPNGVIHVAANDPTKLLERDALLAIQYVGLGGFAATWIGGAVQARINFKPIVTTVQEQPHVTGGALLFSAPW
jgi:tetratricopeptide (TPR) repeat protein